MFGAKESDNDYQNYKRIITWEALVERVNQLLYPMDHIYAKGYWKARSWKGQNGEEKTVQEFIAQNVWIEKDGSFIDVMELE